MLTQDDLALIAELTARQVRETMANANRGDGGINLSVPVIRTGTVLAGASPGTSATVRVDGDTDAIEVVNALGVGATEAERVLVGFVPPQGVYALASMGGGALTPFTPVVAGTGWAIGDATYEGYWTWVGRLIYAYFSITWGNTSTFGAAAGLEVGGLPYVVDNTGWAWGDIMSTDGGSFYPGIWRLANGASQGLAECISTSSTYAALTTILNNRPIVWASGDQIYGSVLYKPGDLAG